MSPRFPALLLLLLSLGCSAGTVYKSRGVDGRTVYSDQPVANAKDEKALSFSDAPATPLPDSVMRYRESLQKTMQTRLSEARSAPASVPRLFSAEWCGYCRKAKAYLAEKGIAYEELDIDTEAGMRGMIEAGGGGKGIPLLLWRGQKVVGFSTANYDRVFNKR